MRWLLALAVVAALGCDTAKTVTTAPTVNDMQFKIGDPTSDDVRWVWVDATHVAKITTVSRWDAKLQRVIVGTIKVVYVCDYPNDFIGPLPSGHCHEDGTNCSG